MTLAHLCLGTASWATDQPYNDRTPPSDEELVDILDVAEARGIRWLDTAVAYGNVELRLAALGASQRFKIVTKVRPQFAPPYPVSKIDCAALLFHLTQDDDVTYHGFTSETDEGELWGVSAYTVNQAQRALEAGVQVLQVPWNMAMLEFPPLTAPPEAILGWKQSIRAWMAIRDRAYADGVLFFGRQPFNKGRPQGMFRQSAFEFALRTNPRGWCVVGVETAAQVEELCRWREEEKDRP